MMWILSTFFLSVISWAQVGGVLKVSEALVVASPEEAKKELVFKAGFQTMQKFAGEIGFKEEDLKVKLEEKFQLHFENYKGTKLIEKFGKGYQETLSTEEKAKFLEDLESHRHEEYKKFTHVNDFIQSFSVKSFSMNDTVPVIYNGEIQISMDKIRMDRFIRQILFQEKKLFSKLWLVTEFSLNGFAWKDMGLEKETSFTGPLAQAWEKYLLENMPQDLGEVGLCQNECLVKFQEWESTSQESLSKKPSLDFQKSIMGKISLTLKRNIVSESAREYEFVWEGRFVLINADTKLDMGSFTLGPETKGWRGLDQKALNSALASRLYRTPLPFFNEIQSKIAAKAPLNSTSKLTVIGHQNMGDVLVLIELLKTRGSSLGLTINLGKMNQKEAQLVCFYKGEEKSFSDLLSQLKELKSSKSYGLVHEYTGVSYVLKLVAE